jgi:DNA-binding NtrC family response regulator
LSIKEDYVTDANILLVDDDAQFIAIMKKRLTMRRMEVFHAGSGEEAMQKLAAHGEIEVVILDVKLPGKSGIEMLQLIKQQFPLVEVIMLTGHATVESAIDGMRLGASDYLMKPCGIEVLVEKVREAVEKKRRHEEKIVDARVREIASRRS